MPVNGPFKHMLGTIPGAGSAGSLQTAGSLWLLPAVCVNPRTPTRWRWRGTEGPALHCQSSLATLCVGTSVPSLGEGWGSCSPRGFAAHSYRRCVVFIVLPSFFVFQNSSCP